MKKWIISMALVLMLPLTVGCGVTVQEEGPVDDTPPTPENLEEMQRQSFERSGMSKDPRNPGMTDAAGDNN